MRFFCLLLLSVFHVQSACAGQQQEEQMADSVRLVLTQAVADAPPPRPEFPTIKERIIYLNWLGEMSDRLRGRVPDRQGRIELLESAWYESRRAGLDPALVLGLIQVESAFRKYAISSAGAVGYMQVMPFWTRVIGDGDHRKLFPMRSNLRYGCVVLRHYLDQENGDYFMALGRYNGSRGQPAYPRAVLRARSQWETKNDMAREDRDKR